MTAATFAPPVVAPYGSTDPTAPLVVLLHGRGSSEAEILGLAPRLPVGPEYAAVRAPITEGRHQLTAQTVHHLGEWLATFVEEAGALPAYAGGRLVSATR